MKTTVTFEFNKPNGYSVPRSEVRAVSHEEHLGAVNSLILERVRQGYGTVLEVMQSGYIQREIHKARMASVNEAFEAYLNDLIALQKSSAD